MSVSKRGLKAAALACAAMAILFSCKGNSDKTAGKPIRIAVNCPLTGDAGEYGASFKRSIELANDAVNAAGGLLGKQVELVFGDSKANAQEAATLAQKVTSDKTIFAQIGDFNSACCMSAQPIYDAAGMIQLSPTASHMGFAKGSKWSFEVLGTQDIQGQFMADWVYNGLGIKKVSVLYLNSDWGLSASGGFISAFEALGGTILAKEFYFDGERDFTAVLTKLRTSGPEAIFVACYYNDGAAINLQRQRLGFEVPVISPGTVYSPKFIELGGTAVEGVLTNVGFFPDDPTPEAKAFIDAYNAKYGTNPDYYGACAYDAYGVLVKAIKDAGALDSAKVRDVLAATKDFPGVSGSITFNENGDARKTYIKLTIKDGKFAVVR